MDPLTTASPLFQPQQQLDKQPSSPSSVDSPASHITILSHLSPSTSEKNRSLRNFVISSQADTTPPMPSIQDTVQNTCTYRTAIISTLTSNQNKPMTTAEICESISNNYPHFTVKKSWKKQVGRTLSISPELVKTIQNQDTRASYWTYQPQERTKKHRCRTTRLRQKDLVASFHSSSGSNLSTTISSSTQSSSFDAPETQRHLPKSHKAEETPESGRVADTKNPASFIYRTTPEPAHYKYSPARLIPQPGTSEAIMASQEQTNLFPLIPTRSPYTFFTPQKDSVSSPVYDEFYGWCIYINNTPCRLSPFLGHRLPSPTQYIQQNPVQSGHYPATATISLPQRTATLTYPYTTASSLSSKQGPGNLPRMDFNT